MSYFHFLRPVMQVCFLAFILSNQAYAQAADAKRVKFAAGASGTVIEDRISGDQTAKYLLGATAGQMLSVDLLTSNGAAYFNIIAPGADSAMFLGETTGNIADVSLPATGDYVVEVYLMRSAARRKEAAKFSLTISIHGGDYADGLAGGPDYWKVQGLEGGDLLNVRRGPSANYAATGKLQNGDVLKNNGCRMTLDERWCNIRATHLGTMGWVAGRFLVETAAPASPEMPEGGPVGNGVPFDATGSVKCTLKAGEPAGDCLIGVIRQGLGNAGVWIAIGGGKERQILFESYKAVAVSPAEEFEFKKDNDLYSVDIGAEHYEIPEAVIDGG